MKKFEIIVVGKAFITMLTTTPDGQAIVDVNNSKLLRIECWKLTVTARDEQAAGCIAADEATRLAYEEYGEGPLWACLPIASMEIGEDADSSS